MIAQLVPLLAESAAHTGGLAIEVAQSADRSEGGSLGEPLPPARFVAFGFRGAVG